MVCISSKFKILKKDPIGVLLRVKVSMMLLRMKDLCVWAAKMQHQLRMKKHSFHRNIWNIAAEVQCQDLFRRAWMHIHEVNINDKIIISKNHH